MKLSQQLLVYTERTKFQLNPLNGMMWKMASGETYKCSLSITC